MYQWFRNVAVTFVVGGAILVGSTMPLQAADRKCEKGIRKTEQALNKAQRKYGNLSRQAEDRRRDLERQRAACFRDRDRR